VRTKSLPLLLAVLFLALALAAVPAAADEPGANARAKALYQQGMKHYNLARFDKALASFEEAYLVVPDPVFLFNIGQCHRLMGSPEKSAYAYRRYLVTAPGAPNRVAVEKFISDAEDEIRRRQSAVQPAETLAPREPAPAPPPVESHAAPAPLGEGPAPSAPVEGKVTAEPPAAAARTPVYKRWWLWTAVAGVVVVGAGVGVGLAVGSGSDAPVHAGSYGSGTVVF
jgi:tetratricopeptide (TPR) repeat protein